MFWFVQCMIRSKQGRLDYFVTSVHSRVCSRICLNNIPIVSHRLLELINSWYSFSQSLLLNVNEFVQSSDIHHHNTSEEKRTYTLRFAQGSFFTLKVSLVEVGGGGRFTSNLSVKKLEFFSSMKHVKFRLWKRNLQKNSFTSDSIFTFIWRSRLCMYLDYLSIYIQKQSIRWMQTPGATILLNRTTKTAE